MRPLSRNISFPLLLALLLPLQACATTYSAEPIEARVVDAETNQPVEGVVVVAHWQLQGGLEGGNNVGQMMVLESVTDAQGKFNFPAWGPKEMPGGLSVWHRNARLQNMDPEMLLFKSGYEYRRLLNDKYLDEISGVKPYVRKSDWNGQTIKIKRFQGDLNKYAYHLNELFGDLDRGTATRYCSDAANGTGCRAGSGCEWKSIPHMISAIGRQAKIFEEANLHHSTFYDSLLGGEEFFSKTGCGSVDEFFRKHVK